jgi:hypothetical protein
MSTEKDAGRHFHACRGESRLWAEACFGLATLSQVCVMAVERRLMEGK